LLDDPVEFAGADAHAPAVQRRVRPAVDHAAAPGRDLDPIAVAPHAGVGLEVAGAVPTHLGIVPEAHRHRWERLGDDELPDLPEHRTPLLVEGLELGPQAPALDLPGAHGQAR